ncbi:MAG: hypothetical protein EBZ49_00060 [Proteobacteria bacterium]|nr:hypothetical protein [Pseudomonadota bacterium]
MNDLFKELVFDVVIKEAIRRLFLAVPFLEMGPIGYIVSLLLTRFADSLYEYQKTVVRFYKFEFVNSKNQKQFDQEMKNLQTLQKNPNATPEEINEAIQKAKERLADLVRYSS